MIFLSIELTKIIFPVEDALIGSTFPAPYFGNAVCFFFSSFFLSFFLFFFPT